MDDFELTQWVRFKMKLKTEEPRKMEDHTLTKDEFIKHFMEQIIEFKEHVTRVRIQFQQRRQLKDKLPRNTF